MLSDESISTALQQRRPVRIKRGDLQNGHIDCFVVDSSRLLVLVHVISDQVLLDGFYVIRRDDVTAIQLPCPYASFQETALRLRNELPDFDASLDLSSIKSVLRSISSQSEVLVIHIEEVDADVCYIGKLTRLSDEDFELTLLSPSATWEDPETYAYSQITRVDYGGLYEDALMQVAKLSS